MLLNHVPQHEAFEHRILCHMQEGDKDTQKKQVFKKMQKKKRKFLCLEWISCI